MQDLESVEAHITKKTKLIWVETPTNPMMNIVDIKAISAIAKAHNIVVAVDNTFASPYLQQPLELGASIVMHSATKYLAGHSDTILGLVTLNDTFLYEKLAFIQNSSGAVPGPMDSFLTLRGIKTLHIRMQRHSENGSAIAKFLKENIKVEKVYWPGFPDHPNHDIAKSQMKFFGGMISFLPEGGDRARAFKIIENLKIFTLAESLGGVESLAGHPASMTHASIPKEIREKKWGSGWIDSSKCRN
jgi:cystathionine beta-lyase